MYLPPEIVGKHQEKETKPWSHDMWSFGIVLLEISSGIPAHVQNTCKI